MDSPFVCTEGEVDKLGNTRVKMHKNNFCPQKNCNTYLPKKLGIMFDRRKKDSKLHYNFSSLEIHANITYVLIKHASFEEKVQ